jgi:hypothetical protein
MGDRALIIFEHNGEVSPVVYLHWSGSRVPALLQTLKERMQGREGDVSYTTARFIGICHESIDGNLSLGVWNLPVETLVAVKTRGLSSEADKELADYSHGDAGVVVVNAKDFTFEAYGGYLATEKVAAKPLAA